MYWAFPFSKVSLMEPLRLKGSRSVKITENNIDLGGSAYKSFYTQLIDKIFFLNYIQIPTQGTLPEGKGSVILTSSLDIFFVKR
jgi:hypothetical protein